MATWGSWVSGQSGSKSRLGFDRTISDTGSQRTVKLTVYYEFSGYYLNSNATLTLSGGHSASQAVNLSFSGSGTRTLGTFTQVFTRPWGAADSRTTNLSISGSAGGNPTAKTTYSLPRRLYSAPAAPTSAVAEWTANGRARLTWASSSTTAAPVEQVELLRQSNYNAWGTNPSTMNTVNGSTSFSNLADGSRYRWRVTTKNRDARGGSRDSNWVYMRPRAVSNVVLERSGSNLTVSWVSLNAVDYGFFRIFHNGAQVAVMGPSARSATITNPDPSVSHQVEVQAYYDNLDAARVKSNTVQLLAPPLAPTNLSPDGGYVVQATSVPLSWSHNSVDGSSQTAYELQVRRVGTTSWTTYTGTAAETRNISVSTFASNGQSIEWQVRTKGDHATYGPYSSVSSFEVASRPSVSITAPASGATITSASTPLTFTINRVPASYAVELRRGTTTVQTIEDYTTSSPVTVQLLNLQDGQSYTARVTATEKVDSTTVTRSFSVAYAQPSAPSLSGSWDIARGAVNLVTQRTTGTPITTAIRVETWDGAEWVEVETISVASSPVTVVVDYARLDMGRYRAVALATVGGSIVESVASEEVDLGAFPAPAHFLNFGDRVVKLRYNPGLTRSPSASDLQLVDLDDGTADPVAIFGPKERRTATLSGLLLDEAGLSAREQAREFEALAVWKDLVLLRTADGPPVWGVVTGVSMPLEIWGGYQVSLTHTKAR